MGMDVQKNRNPAQAPAHLSFLLLHTQRFRPTAFVIIPAEMEHTMDQQRHELLFQRPTSSPSLALSHGQRDDYLAEVRGKLRKAMRRSRLPKGKRQNIRTTILFPIPAVEPPHSAIAHEQNIHLCGRLSNKLQHGLGQSQNPPAADRHGADMDLEGNGH